MADRAQAMLAALPGGAQAALLHNRTNIRYFSGYTGEGLALIDALEHAIITDFRYTEQAMREAPAFAVHEITPQAQHNAVAFARVQAAGVTTVAVEEDALTYADYKALCKAMPGVTFVSLEGVPESMRQIKDADEIELLAQANALTARGFDHICGFIRPGLTEKQIAIELWRWLLENGAESLAFDTIVASGPNGSLCHAIPGPRAVRQGDLITLDFGAKVGGYCADMTRTLALGKISDEQRRMYDTVRQAQQLALDAAKPGAACRDVDAAARVYIDAAGYAGRFGHGLGHATGLDIHEDPRCNTTTQAILKPGMTMTIEPGVYIPDVGGVRIEDSVVITDTGCRILTPATKDLVVL
ncbi:MAG: Xaa-Pro peptidase family protein [Oscillospiraceae bacterium]|nr:Xaa-Pro peptidase family protein [Oscillospiraceae bacterium]